MINSNLNAKSHHNKTSNFTIKTVNVRGISDIVETGTLKYICKNRSLLNDSLKLTNYDPHFKILSLLLFIIRNKNSIIVLTETKLKDKKEDIFSFCNLIKKLTNDSFWIFCNNKEKKTASGGVTTLIPKKYFKKPNHEIFKKGMVTSSNLEFIKSPFISFTLISYYNPKLSENSFLAMKTFESFSNINNLIIVGDFNQLIDYHIDYHRNKDSILPTTISKKILKANKFNEIVNNANLNYKRIDNNFTFKKDDYESRIDWIFYSNFFKNLDNTLEIEKNFIQSDHHILSQNFDLNKKKKNLNRKNMNFKIPDQIFKDKSFTNELKKIIRKNNRKNIDESKKLEISIRKTFQHYKYYNKRKNIEKKK